MAHIKTLKKAGPLFVFRSNRHDREITIDREKVPGRGRFPTVPEIQASTLPLRQAPGRREPDDPRASPGRRLNSPGNKEIRFLPGLPDPGVRWG